MKDYHVLSMDSIGGKVTDHGVALSISDIPWFGRQLWAPDAAFAVLDVRFSIKNIKLFYKNCNL